ncbi:MAG: nitrogenase stabilizing/protective protein NifW [Pseudomonadota bacterium]|nr:nitrogenase stabilizing/protective protein NifW [Pseudomonadota bacterium]
MSELLARLQALSAAEEFLEFFQVPYDPAVVQVNRLHILKRFHQYLAQLPAEATLDAADGWHTARALLLRAYEDFVRSTPAQERVFKVFQDADGQRVSVDTVRASLPSRQPGG